MKGRSKLKFDFIPRLSLAAQSGRGVALGRTYGADVCSCRAIWCVRWTWQWPLVPAAAHGGLRRSMARSEVRAFVDWLLAETRKFNGELDAPG